MVATFLWASLFHTSHRPHPRFVPFCDMSPLSTASQIPRHIISIDHRSSPSSTSADSSDSPPSFAKNNSTGVRFRFPPTPNSSDCWQVVMSTDPAPVVEKLRSASRWKHHNLECFNVDYDPRCLPIPRCNSSSCRAIFPKHSLAQLRPWKVGD